MRLAAFLAVLDDRKTSRAEKIFFREKNGHMANLASRWAQKWAIFFIVVPKFTPRKNDQKGVRNAGAHNFHDIWAFGGPDLVKNGQKSAL